MKNKNNTKKIKAMNTEIRKGFNNYISENKQLKRLFDDLSTEDGIMLQSFMEDFAETQLKQNTEARPNETIVMWRSVENKMPDAFVSVLAADKRGRIYLVEFDGGNFIQTTEGEYAYDIIHWAPLPEPPQTT